MGSQPSNRPRATSGGGSLRRWSIGLTPPGPRTPPRLTTTSWSATVNRPAARCSAITTTVPFSARSAHAASTAAAPQVSSCDVGSSRARMRGSRAMADAMATRCRSPPDSDAVARPARWLTPAASIAPATRSRINDRGTAVFSRANATSSSTFARTNCDPGSRNTKPTSRGSAEVEVRTASRPSTQTWPLIVPPWKWGTSPFSRRSSVDLPLPDGPATAVRPGSKVNVTFASDASAAPGYVYVRSRIIDPPRRGRRAAGRPRPGRRWCPV